MKTFYRDFTHDLILINSDEFSNNSSNIIYIESFVHVTFYTIQKTTYNGLRCRMLHLQAVVLHYQQRIDKLPYVPDSHVLYLLYVQALKMLFWLIALEERNEIKRQRGKEIERGKEMLYLFEYIIDSSL